MTDALPPFIDVTGCPAVGEPVDPTPRAATHLVAAGWTPPQGICVICGLQVEGTKLSDGLIETHWECERPLLEDPVAS